VSRSVKPAFMNISKKEKFKTDLRTQLSILRFIFEDHASSFEKEDVKIINKTFERLINQTNKI